MFNGKTPQVDVSCAGKHGGYKWLVLTAFVSQNTNPTTNEQLPFSCIQKKNEKRVCSILKDPHHHNAGRNGKLLFL